MEGQARGAENHLNQGSTTHLGLSQSPFLKEGHQISNHMASISYAILIANHHQLSSHVDL